MIILDKTILVVICLIVKLFRDMTKSETISINKLQWNFFVPSTSYLKSKKKNHQISSKTKNYSILQKFVMYYSIFCYTVLDLCCYFQYLFFSISNSHFNVYLVWLLLWQTYNYSAMLTWFHEAASLSFQ